ncbi:peptidylprolyl isomerase [Flavobacteriaceae bacterium F08102]|nr:peptidylprolyl isomerase [Flavobacteriaceae bacterium F08102]
MNSTLIRLFLVGFSFLIVACKSDSPSSTTSVTTHEKRKANPRKSNVKATSEVPQKPEEKRPLDSINQENAIDFLIAYDTLNPETKVKIETKFGDIILRLFKDVPLHRASFIFLTKMGYFDTTCFYRVVPNFVVQAGNSELRKTSEIRNKYENYTIPPEFRSHRKHNYGAVAAARQYENNISKKSTPFEFYIVTKKNGAHYLDGKHTVFGEVISGMSVAERISRLKTGSDDWPYEDVFIKASIIE